MGTTTAKLALYKPAVGETGWGANVNTNFDKLDGYVYNVRGYGATGDGTTDDTTAVQAAITAAAAGGIVYFPPGSYVCNGLTIANSNITFAGDGFSSKIFQKAGAADNTNVFNANSGSATVANNITGLTWQNLYLRGRSDTDGFLEHVHLIALNGVSDVTVRNCLIRGFRGDGVYFGGDTGGERHNERLIVTGCTFDGINKENRNAISIIDGTDVVISNNTFTSCSKSTMPGAIDVEPNSAVYPRTRSITIIGNTFRDAGGGIGGCVSLVLPTQSTLTNKAQNFAIVGNTFQSVSLAGVYVQTFEGTSTSTVPHNILIANNVMQDGWEPIDLFGIRGVRITGNSFDDFDDAMILGYQYNVCDIQVSNNTFSRCGSNGNGLFQIIRAQRATFQDNYIYDTNASSEYFKFTIDSAGVSDNIWSIQNSFRNGGTTFSSKNASHTLNVGSNKAYQNDTPSATPSGSHWTVS